MPSITVQARRDAPSKPVVRNDRFPVTGPPAGPVTDHDRAADAVAHVLDLADAVRADLAEGTILSLAKLIVEAGELTEVVAGWQVDDLDEITGRLWMLAR